MTPAPDQAKHTNDEAAEALDAMQPAKDRSVADFQSAEALADALKAIDIDGEKDWTLKNFDEETTVADPNNIDDEVERLMILKSYNILDTENEAEYDVLTDEAKRYFGCPIAVVSLVDFGRQWFKSIQGLPVESTPRCVAFCSHVVKIKDPYACMVVPDATKDDRFKDNPLVTGGPKIRFYAGAPLVTPEGARLGSFCVIGTETRPEGLTSYEIQRLKLFAQETVLLMILRDV